MAARRWKEHEAARKCHDCGKKIGKRRLALGRKCCAGCAGTRADYQRKRRQRIREARGRQELPPPPAAGE